MSIEQALTDLTAAVKDLTAAMKAGATAGAAAAPAAEKPAKGTKATPPAPAPAPAAPAIDRSEVNAALEAVKEKHGVDTAKKIISEAGGVAKRADIPESKFQAVIDACKAAVDGDGGDDM
jgi:hypothetical protein